MNPDGTGLKNLTNNSSSDVRPSWSPNSQDILQSNAPATGTSYTMNANGTSPTRLTTSTSTNGEPAYSPDRHEDSLLQFPGR